MQYDHKNYFKPSPTSVMRHDYRLPCDADRPDRVTPRCIKARQQRGALPTDQFFRHHGKAYDCNKITWYDEIFNGRRRTDQGGCMNFPETRRWTLIHDAWKPEKSDYPLQGPYPAFVSAVTACIMKTANMSRGLNTPFT